MAEKEKDQGPFYEQRWFQGTVAVVGLLGAVWAFSGAPKPWDAATDLTTTELARADTQIILDASAGMAAPFGEGTKFDAAVAAIKRYARPLEHEGLSLRRTASGCEDENELLVGFGEGHADDVIAAAEEQRPEGASTLAYAVIEAINEFTNLEQRSGPARQVVIITGGVGEDECLGNEAAVEIRRQLKRTGIEATFKMVALKPSRQARERLDDFAAALGEQAEVEVVETEEELEEVVASNLQGLVGEIDEPFDPEAESSPPADAESSEPIEAETTAAEVTAEEGGEAATASGGVGEIAPTDSESASAGGTEPVPPPAVEESAAPVEEPAPVP